MVIFLNNTMEYAGFVLLRIDLTGQRFGSLVVEGEVGRAKDGSIIWGCICDCGSPELCKVVGRKLREGLKINCGCMHGNRIDLVGKKFGRLTVVAIIKDDLNNTALWLCRCECGEEILAKAGDLNGGSTSSCGCLKSPNLEGKRFGRLIVQKKLNEKKHGYYVWECKCDCGEFVKATTQDLTGERKQSCGCLEHEFEDLTGTKWERLTVIKLADHRNNKGELLWECSCSCESNKQCFISRDKLVKGHTKSCGCLLKEHRGKNHSRWNNGVTKISKKLRNTITPWKIASLEKYDYRCYITGLKGKDIKVHHSNENYPFYKIVEETFEVLGFEIKPNLGDYTGEQIDLLEKTCLSLHFKNGLGIPLKEELHKEFHAVYGTKGWTQLDFIEFVESKRKSL